MAPTDARTLIKTRVQEAIAVAKNIEPLIAKRPVMVEVTHPDPDRLSVPEGVERVDDVTIRCQGESFWQVFHNMVYGKPDFPVPA